MYLITYAKYLSGSISAELGWNTTTYHPKKLKPENPDE